MSATPSIQDDQLRIMAMYNYGVALYLLSQDWAYERASTTFRQLLNELEKSNKLDNPKLRNLIRSSLAATYAKMAVRSTDRKSELANLADQEADKVLKDIHADKTSRANALAAKGFAHLSNNDPSMAISYFKNSLEENPGSIHSLLGLGESYLRSDHRDEALATFKQAVRLSPLSGYAAYRLGNIYRELKEYDEAIDTLQKAPEHPYSRLVLGKIYLELDRLNEALEEFRSATKLNSRIGEAWVNIAWIIHQLQEKDLYKEAEIAARRGLQLERNKSQLWHPHSILALCLLDQGRYEPALKEAKKSLELSDKSRAQAYYTLAYAQYELDNFSQSIENLNKVFELDKKGDWIMEASKLRENIKERTKPK